VVFIALWVSDYNFPSRLSAQRFHCGRRQWFGNNNLHLITLVSRERRLFRKRGLGVDVLRRGNSLPKLDRITVCSKNQFQLCNGREKIMKIEVAEVRKPEDLSFHGALTVRDDGIKPAAEFFHNHA